MHDKRSGPRPLPGRRPRGDRRAPGAAARAPLDWAFEATSFVGRDDALRELHGHLEAGARLVTILGAAGLGKTRLLRRFGGARLGASVQVWFCDLTPARSLNDILATVAGALGVPLSADVTVEDAIAGLGRILAGHGRALLLVDNFEQLVEHAEATVGRWLRLAPAVAILVTSRRALGLEEEVRLELAPLSVAEGTALFDARARLVRAAPGPSDDERRAVAAIVGKLDGIPLAIELAAARVAVLDPAQILARLERRFELLRTTRRGGPARHATLERAIDWSWDDLDAAERRVLAQCSTFRGGFSLDAVEAVVDLPAPPDACRVLDVVQALRERSLMRRRDLPGGRLELYESIREYAAGKLEPALERAAVLRHALHYVAEAERQVARAQGPEGPRALAWLGLELDNLLAVVHRGAVAAVLRLRAALAADVLLARRGPFTARVELLEACAPLLDGLDDRRALARHQRALGGARRRCGRLAEARGALERALAVARDSEDHALASRVLRELGDVAFDGSAFDEAAARYREAIAAAHRADDAGALAEALASPMGGDGVSLARIEELLAHVDELPVRAALLFNAGLRRALAGDFTAALDLYGRGRTLAADIGDRALEMHLRAAITSMEHALGRLDGAEASYAELLAGFEATGDRRLAGMTLTFWGMLRCAEGRWTDAGELLRRGVALSAAVGEGFTEGLGAATLAAAEAVGGHLAAAERHLARARGRMATIAAQAARADLPEVVALLAGAVELRRAREAAAQGRPALAAELRAAVRRRLEHLEAFRSPRENRFGMLLGGLVLQRAVLEDSLGPAPTAAVEAGAPPTAAVEAGAPPAAAAGAPPTAAVEAGAPSAAAAGAPPTAAVEAGAPSAAAPAPSPAQDGLEVERAATWFRRGRGPRVLLETRPVLRRLLLCLVDQRLADPGRPVPTATLVRTGWPGERIAPNAATNRLHNAIAILRGLGLRGVLRRMDTGYFLDPEVPVRGCGLADR